MRKKASTTLGRPVCVMLEKLELDQSRCEGCCSNLQYLLEKFLCYTMLHDVFALFA